MRPIVKDSTDQSTIIYIMDTSDGTPETGVQDSTAGIDLWYRREGSTLTAIVETTLAAVNSAHADGGIIHIAQGNYRLDLPDAAVATGVDGVLIGGSVGGMIVIGPYIPLFDVDPYDSTRAGMTALPDAAADAAGGLPISDAGGLDLDTIYSTAIAILADTDDIGAGGSLLSAIPWNAAWDTEVQSEVEDALGSGGSLLSAIPWNAAWDAEVESEVDDALGAGGSLLSAIPWNSDWDAEVESEVDDALGGGTGTALTAIPWNSDWDTEVESEVQDVVGAGGSLLSGIPWNANWDAEVQSEAADALTAGLGSVADAVWDEAYSDHRGSTSFGLWVAKGIAKGQAWSNDPFCMVDSTDNVTPKTGLTITAYVSKDAAAFGAIAGTVAEISNGIYQMDATAADMNFDIGMFRFTATGASDTFIAVKTS